VRALFVLVSATAAVLSACDLGHDDAPDRCVPEPPLGSALPRETFDHEWVLRRTVLGTESGASTLTFPGDQSALERVHWVVVGDAKRLEARRTGDDSLVAAWDVMAFIDFVSHRTNLWSEPVCVADVDDSRPPGERDYLEIDWSKDLAATVTGLHVTAPLPSVEPVAGYSTDAFPRIEARHRPDRSLEAITVPADVYVELADGSADTIYIQIGLMRSPDPEPIEPLALDVERYGYIRSHRFWDHIARDDGTPLRYRERTIRQIRYAPIPIAPLDSISRSQLDGTLSAWNDAVAGAIGALRERECLDEGGTSIECARELDAARATPSFVLCECLGPGMAALSGMLDLSHLTWIDDARAESLSYALPGIDPVTGEVVQGNALLPRP